MGEVIVQDRKPESPVGPGSSVKTTPQRTNSGSQENCFIPSDDSALRDRPLASPHLNSATLRNRLPTQEPPRIPSSYTQALVPAYTHSCFPTFRKSGTFRKKSPHQNTNRSLNARPKTTSSLEYRGCDADTN